MGNDKKNYICNACYVMGDGKKDYPCTFSVYGSMPPINCPYGNEFVKFIKVK